MTVYNFQTGTGNYFAAGILVHNCDLHARHLWLVRQESMRERVIADPEFCDCRAAGYWVWGLSCWIGSGWCDVDRYDRRGRDSTDQKRPNMTSNKGVNRNMEDADFVVKKKRPHMSSAQGINRNLDDADFSVPSQLPLMNCGSGVNRNLDDMDDFVVTKKIPQIDSVRGVHTLQGSHQDAPGTIDEPSRLRTYFRALQARLQGVRVACGDWTRVLGPCVTTEHGITAVFLDPPYSTAADRDPKLYNHENLTIATDVRQWAIEAGKSKLFRIALCGYESEHALPGDWECVEWKAGKGYSTKAGKATVGGNRFKERVWFSPHCVKPVDRYPLFAGEVEGDDGEPGE